MDSLNEIQFKKINFKVIRIYEEVNFSRIFLLLISYPCFLKITYD